MPGGSNEVETGVDPGVVVGVQHPFDLQLLMQVGVKLGVNVVHDGLPAEMSIAIKILGFKHEH